MKPSSVKAVFAAGCVLTLTSMGWIMLSRPSFDISYVSRMSSVYLLGETTLSDIFISVKTSTKTYARLDDILDTWLRLAKNSTYIVSDTDNATYRNKFGKQHFIASNCPEGHDRAGLCCKMAAEFHAFVASGRRWWCHVDDDNYVNVPALLRMVQDYNHDGVWYLGRPSHWWDSTRHDRHHEIARFRFATGGAGFCISTGLARKMLPFTVDFNMEALCSRLSLNDDVVIGCIITHYLQTNLTSIEELHSHYEKPESFNVDQNVITLSYYMGNKLHPNVVDVEGFTVEDDPTRLRSVHCLLNPDLQECVRMRGDLQRRKRLSSTTTTISYLA